MKVFKFGGASVKDAAGVRNLANIVSSQGQDTVVVVSAMGKTTNALESIVRAYVDKRSDALQTQLADLRTYHTDIMNELTGNFSQVHHTFAQLENYLKSPASAYMMKCMTRSFRWANCCLLRLLRLT